MIIVFKRHHCHTEELTDCNIPDWLNGIAFENIGFGFGCGIGHGNVPKTKISNYEDGDGNGDGWCWI